VQRHHGLDAVEVERVLDEESGLLGLAGAADMRAVEEAARRGERDALLALEVYVYRLRSGIAAMAAAMGGVDAVTFTGGVGEGSAQVRATAIAGLGFIGLAVDPVRNEAVGEADRELSPPDAHVKAFLVHAREDLEVAREVRTILKR
jgi:acetate kinase